MSDKIVGKHIFGSMYNVKEERIYYDEKFSEELVKEMVRRANASLIEVKTWKIEGKKGGISVIALVEESHIAIHSWKEYKYFTFDIYTCGNNTSPSKAFEYLVEKLKPEKLQYYYSDRSQL